MARKNPAPDEELPRTFKIEEARETRRLSDSAVRLAEFAATMLVAAETKGVKTKPLENFWLAPAQRDLLLDVPGIAKVLRAKLVKEQASFTVADIASLTMTLAEASMESQRERQLACLLVAKHLTERLEAVIAVPAKAESKRAKRARIKADSTALFQFKITLIGSNPPIWRRILVADGTLDQLHEHIQTAMGWTNSHLHQFEIGRKRYGDPELLDDGFDDLDCKDSTRTRISKIVPRSGQRFRFTYEYDFGDGWQHEILFEGRAKKESGKSYPLCLEGERACPPEDVGGIVGFYGFLEALADPKHVRHEDFQEWGADFDPEKFDAAVATNEMKNGLPNWPATECSDFN